MKIDDFSLENSFYQDSNMSAIQTTVMTRLFLMGNKLNAGGVTEKSEKKLASVYIVARYHLLAVEQFPDSLSSLLINNHPQFQYFLANIRKYNVCFQMRPI